MNIPNNNENDIRIVYLDEYHPYWIDKEARIKNPLFNQWSSYILDLKNNEELAIQFFFDQIELWQTLEIEANVAITIVPSHDPERASRSGLCRLAQRLAANRRIDATHCLRRYIRIPKLSHGGGRSIHTHLDSIRIENSYLIKNQVVWLLDDVTTSGNSLMACRQILLEAGARMVKCLALGKTTRIT